MPWVNLQDTIVDGFKDEPLPVDAGGTGAVGLADFAGSMAAHANEMMVWALNGGEAIPANADLDDYIEPGNYYCASTNTASTISNTPQAGAFNMKVYRATGIGFATQEFEAYWSGETYRRLFDENTASWNSWVCVQGIDSIVAQGTSGGWTWVKYASGGCEMIMKYEGLASDWAANSSGVFLYIARQTFALPFTVYDADIASFGNDWTVQSLFAYGSDSGGGRDSGYFPDSCSYVTAVEYGRDERYAPVFGIAVHGAWK